MDKAVPPSSRIVSQITLPSKPFAPGDYCNLCLKRELIQYAHFVFSKHMKYHGSISGPLICKRLPSSRVSV